MYVLSDGKDYYIELQRMRKDDRPDTSDYGALRGLAFYSIRDEKIDGEIDFYRLPKQQALYIIGKSNNPGKTDKLVIVQISLTTKIKSSSCFTSLPMLGIVFFHFSHY